MTQVNRAKRSIINISYSFLNRLIAVLLPFVVRTTMIYTIGIVYLGLDSLFISILNMLSLSELGFSSAIIFSMYKPMAIKDDNKIVKLLNFYKKVYRIVGLVISVVGLALLPFLEYLIADGTDVPSDINIYFVYLVFLANTAIPYFLFAYKTSVLVASMRNDVDSLFDTIRSIISHGLQITVLLLFKLYYLYILVLPVATIVNDLIRNFYVNKKYPQYKGKSNLDKREKKEIMKKVGALIGNKIGGVVFTSADSIVISSTLGLITLAQFSNYFTIYTAVLGLISTVYNSIQSVIGNSLVINSRERNMSLFKSLFLVNSIVTLICCSLFITLYQPFITIWVGAENVLPNEIPILFSIYFLVRNSRRILVIFKEAAGMWEEDFLKPYVSTTINIGLNILLIFSIGLPGIIISSIVSILFIEIPWETHVFFKKYFKKKPTKYYLCSAFSASITIFASFMCSLKCESIQYGIAGLILRFIITLSLCILISAPFLLLTSSGKKIINRIMTFKKSK